MRKQPEPTHTLTVKEPDYIAQKVAVLYGTTLIAIFFAFFLLHNFDAQAFWGIIPGIVLEAAGIFAINWDAKTYYKLLKNPNLNEKQK